MSAPGVVLFCSILGFGSLHATIGLTAEWWALLLSTRLRPERLVAVGSPRRLVVWAALTAAAVLAATSLILRH